MTTTTSILTPPPVERVKELYGQAEQRIQELHRNQELMDRRIARRVDGDHGWSATLRITRSHILQEGLEELADWWEDNIRRAVTDCPEPENARRQSVTSTGRHRILRTVAWRHGASADIVAPSGQWCPVGISIILDFDGHAHEGDIIWPLDLRKMKDTITKTMESALRRGWQPLSTRPQRAKKRIFQDWSGKSPAERGVLEKQPPKPLSPSATWPARSQETGIIRVCQGSEECGYEPKLDSHTRKLSGCNQAWNAHSQQVFEAFQEANPEIQYRKGTPACLLEAGEKRHQCHGAPHLDEDGYHLESRFLRHQELARFPDGKKIMICQPHLHGEGDTQTIQEAILPWRELMPNLTFRMGGPARSWYHPGRSSLVIIGNAEIIERVNTSYEIRAGSEPIKCIHWRNGKRTERDDEK